MNNQNSTATAPAAALPPEIVLTQISFGAMMTQALYVAAKLKIADLLAEKPVSVAELARATETHERSLYRVLRSLAGVGIFAETEPQTFTNTAYSEPLRSDAPNSMRDGAIFMGEKYHYNVWGEMMHSVKTGETAWKKTHGAEVFDYFNENAAEAEIFNRAMTAMSQGSAPAVVEAYDFSGIGTLADIAGGHGFLLAQILKANPNVKGILFDMPPVVASAPALLEKDAVKDRVEIVGGDFFNGVPTADAYVMKHIIHDWDDERSVKILQTIHRAMRDNGKLLIVETVVPEGNEPHFSKLIDLEMLTSPGGAERTANEYRELLAQAGFELKRIVPTKSPMSVIEAVKR